MNSGLRNEGVRLRKGADLRQVHSVAERVDGVLDLKRELARGDEYQHAGRLATAGWLSPVVTIFGLRMLLGVQQRRKRVRERFP